MRRLTKVLVPLVLVAALIAAPAGCKLKRRRTAADEPLSGPATVVHTADPRIAPQLVRGFHGVEQNAWRWTTGSFAVNLAPPATAAQKGAVLRFQFAIPDAVLVQLKSVQVSASVNGVALPPETYSFPGDQTYSHDVPASAFQNTTGLAAVEFRLDKTLPPSAQDIRELGVVASLIGFDAKP